MTWYEYAFYECCLQGEEEKYHDLMMCCEWWKGVSNLDAVKGVYHVCLTMIWY
jgi:hypothetical protein